MMSAFNPYTAGAAPQSPNIQLDTVAQLLGGAGAGVQSLVNGIQKSQEISRSSKVNELLANGGFKNLSEEQARQKLAQMTGGQSLNPIVDANVAEVMANQKAREIAQAKAAAELGLEEFKFGNELTKLNKESGYKTELERLKSSLGLESDLALEEAKAKNNLVETNALFGNQSKLAELKHNLEINSAKKGELPDQWAVLGNGVMYNKTTGETMTPKEYKAATKEHDLIKDLPKDAEDYVRGLSANQKENFKEAYSSGNIAWQPFIVDKKTGAKSGGFFVDLNAKTPLGITISNKRKEQ